MALPSTGSLSIKDLQDEISLPVGNTNAFDEMANIYDIVDYNPASPEDIVLADDFYGEVPNLTATSVNVNPSILTWTVNPGNGTTQFSTNGNALMVGKPGWLSTENIFLTTAENGSMIFTASGNSTLGSANRNSTITFIGQNSNTLATLIVSQSGNPVEISMTPSTSQTFTQTAGTFNQDLEVTNPLVVTGELTGSGFTLGNPTVTNLGTTSRYRFVLSRTQNTTTARQAELNFLVSGSNFGQTRSITHTQSSFAAEIVVSPASYDFAQGGETKAFSVASNTDWEMFTTGDSGFQTSLSSTSGFSTATKNGTEDDTVYVKASNNSTAGNSDRTATLVVRERPWGGSGEVDNTSLTQDGNPLPTYQFSDASISGFAVDDAGTVTAPTSGQGLSLSITYSAGYSNGSFPVVTSAASRSAAVSFTVPSGYDNTGSTLSQTLTTTQAAVSEFISLSSTQGTALDGQGDAFQIAVDTSAYFSTNWTTTISSATPNNSSGWITIMMGGSGTGDGTIYVVVGGNYANQAGYNGNTRYFTIKVTKNGSSLNDTISFSQATGSPPVTKPTASLNPTSLSFTNNQSGTGSSKTVIVNHTGGNAATGLSFYLQSTAFGFYQTDSNVTIVNNSSPWIASWNGNGSFPRTIGVYPISTNSNIASNTGTLNIDISNSGGSNSYTLSVEQTGNISWSTSPTSSKTTNYSAGSFTISLTTNLAWEGTITNSTYSDFKFSANNSESLTGNGTTTITITKTANNRSSNVTGTLVLESTTSGTSETTTITITQTTEPADLHASLNQSFSMSTLVGDITPSTYGQTYAMYVKHTGSTTANVTVSISNENVGHVGLGLYSVSSPGTNSVTVSNVGQTAKQLFIFYQSGNSCKTATITATSAQPGTNNVSFNSSYGSCGAGGLCILFGTKVKLLDGSSKKVELLSVGEILSSKLVDGMPIKNEVDVLDWTSDELNISDDNVTITSITPYVVEEIIDFNNGLIKTSYEHLHLVKKQNLYQVVEARDLEKGDYLIRESGEEVEIKHITSKSGNYTVYKLDVEENDLFIANGILTHNAKNAV